MDVDDIDSYADFTNKLESGNTWHLLTSTVRKTGNPLIH